MDIEINGQLQFKTTLTDEQLFEFANINNNLSQILSENIDRVNEIIKNYEYVFNGAIEMIDPKTANQFFSDIDGLFVLDNEKKCIYIEQSMKPNIIDYELLAICVLYINEYFFMQNLIMLYGELDYMGKSRFDIHKLVVNQFTDNYIETQTYAGHYLWSEYKGEMVD